MVRAVEFLGEFRFGTANQKLEPQGTLSYTEERHRGTAYNSLIP
jgi:hypothetical protein